MDKGFRHAAAFGAPIEPGSNLFQCQHFLLSWRSFTAEQSTTRDHVTSVRPNPQHELSIVRSSGGNDLCVWHRVRMAGMGDDDREPATHGKINNSIKQYGSLIETQHIQQACKAQV